MQGKTKARLRRRKTDGRRGPLPFRPTKKQRRQVETLVAGGISEPAIAAEIGICQNTLRKHFGDELAMGHDRARARVLLRLDRESEAGNVSASKHLDQKFAVAAAAARFTAPESQAKGSKLGKKQQAKADAQEAGEGTAWGDDLKPPAGAAVN